MGEVSNTPSVFLSDADCTLWHGDVLETLRELPAESVDCVVTSPPYWGLRDYGTGAWDGGDAGCDHLAPPTGGPQPTNRPDDGGGEGMNYRRGNDGQFRHTCGKCGATRIDQQLGLEPTPEQYVERMVEVFRELRRVLAAHGTVWLNLGDSYAGGGRGGHGGLADQERWGKFSPPQGEGVDYPSTHRFYGLGRKQRLPYGYQGPKPMHVLKQKDLIGVPWRVAFALQADGWYLRSDIIWSKPNPMPESVTDRPTKAHEYVFLLSKQPRYFFDQEAVREKYQYPLDKRDFQEGNFRRGGTGYIHDGHHPTKGRGPDGRRKTTVQGADGSIQHRDGERWPNGGRNIRSVWEIATQPYPEAHFATFPEELARRCIAAGCPEQVCRVCGKARERVVEKPVSPYEDTRASWGDAARMPQQKTVSETKLSGARLQAWRDANPSQMLGFTDCGCLSERVTESDRTASGGQARPVGTRSEKYRPGIVLDPFIGSGTVAHVARKLGRHSIGIDLSGEYLALAAKRLAQQSLFALEHEPAHPGALVAQEASHDG